MMEASRMLEAEGLDPLSRYMLSWIAVLEEYGAWEWSLRIIALYTSVFLLGIRLIFQHKRGVDWYALLHALVVSMGSLACVYLDFKAYPVLTDGSVTLAQKMCSCDGAFTSLHRILPAITMGYSIFDLIDGVALSPDFAFHGAITVGVFIFFCEHAPQFNTPMLLMEVSTIFLAMVRADFWSPTAAAVVQALFALNFFLFRIVVTPYLWATVMLTMAEERKTEAYQKCFPSYFFPVSLMFGLTFHCLNMFWFYKIVRKIRRKIIGIERVDANNDLAETEGKKKK